MVGPRREFGTKPISQFWPSLSGVFTGERLSGALFEFRSPGGIDPVQRLALDYVTNHIVPRWQNPYNRSIVDAVYDSL